MDSGIEFGDLTIYEDSIFSMILSDDNALFVDENGFVKGEYLTHVFSKISYNGNIDGFENYTPNFTVNFTVSIEKDSNELMQLLFTSNSFYSSRILDMDGNLISIPQYNESTDAFMVSKAPYTIKEAYMPCVFSRVYPNTKNLKKYSKELEKIDNLDNLDNFEILGTMNYIDHNLFDIIKLLKPDKFSIQHVVLSTYSATEVKVTNIDISTDGDACNAFQINDEIEYIIVREPKDVEYESDRTIIYKLLN